MNYKSFFTKAKEVGLDALELHITKSTKFSFSLFKNEIDSYKIADSYKITAKGILNGKVGFASSEKFDKSTPDFIVNNVKENALLNTSEDKNFIFEGSESYKKKNVFNPALQAASAQEKIALVKELDRLIKAKDARIVETECEYEEEVEEVTIVNSYGLKLTHKANYAYVVAAAVAADETGAVKQNYEIKLLTDLSELNVEELANKTVAGVIAQFGSAPCASGKYKCVFNPSVTSNLLSFFLQNISSEAVQKNVSLLKGKLNQQVCSPKLTITEEPLKKNVFFRYFDDEGVATSNKVLIKKGVLQTYLYNLKTANKDGVTTTGNGYTGIRAINVSIKPGKLSEEELLQKVHEGIYIDNVSGLHSGMNAQSGNFSLIAQGFMIRNGVKAEPVSLVTVAGNLFDVFNNVKEVANNNELKTNSYCVPSIYVKSIQVSGK